METYQKHFNLNVNANRWRLVRGGPFPERGCGAQQVNGATDDYSSPARDRMPNIFQWTCDYKSTFVPARSAFAPRLVSRVLREEAGDGLCLLLTLN